LSSYQKPLESFHIEHFRGLQDVRLEGLGQINLLVGVNNSGKTSVLEAISTYCSPVNLREWINVARQRDQESKVWSRVSPLDALVCLFPHYEDFERNELYKGEICISGEGEFPITKLLASCELVEGVNINHALYQPREDREDRINSLEEREIDEIQREENETDEIQRGIHLNITIDRKYKLLGNFPESISKEFYLWPDERITYRTSREDEQIMNQTITPFSHRTDSYPTRLFTQATIAGFKSEVIKLLQSLDPDIEDLEILTSSSGVTSREIPVLYITHRKLGKTPLSNFGDGIRRLLFIALNLIKVQGGILLIDEIETAIHTDALQNAFLWLVRWCQEMNIQLFATTHSLEAVDSLLSATKSISTNDLVLYRLEKEDNKSFVVRLDQERLQRIRNNLGLEVR
jgi:ABC-type multidrug transport system ATPase subunit